MRNVLRLSIVLTTLATLSLAAPASAQEVTRMPEASPQAIGLDTGFENAFIARATYAHRVELGVLQDTRVYARLTLPVVRPDFGDWGIDVGFRATPVAWGNLRLALLAGPVVKSASNELFSAISGGLGATMLFGYEGSRWGLSAEAAYEQLLTTHITHSDTYREVGYADAKDGWYALSGSTARAGVRGGVRFGSVEILAKVGVSATGELRPMNPPFYATLGSSYAF